MEENENRQTRIEKRRKKQRKVISIIRNTILLILIYILSYVVYGMYKEASVRNLDFSKNNNSIVVEANDLNLKSADLVANKKKIKMPEVSVVSKYKGFEVDSRLEIPKIELTTNILKNYSTEGLDTCASKYYGPNANEIGNYCIAGHNNNGENMFNHLIDLEVGDSIFLTDNKNGIVEYIIYDIYKVTPQNTVPLSQETLNKREITLITCVNYSKRRLVIKASEKI